MTNEENNASKTEPVAPPTRGRSPGASTFGFDTMLGKLVVDNGLVTPEELAECNALLEEAGGTSEGHTLSDLLVNHKYITERQIDRLQSDFDTRKSTQRIPGFNFIRKLGSGAMASVFLAQQKSLDRPVAIKVLPTKFSDNKEFIDRFYKEGKAAAKLNHPNIVQAYDVGLSGEHHYFVMEYVDGITAFDRVEEEKQLSEKESISILRQVASALQHAHDAGFIHRDVKPKNIMISSKGDVKLADLGLARAMSDVESAEAEAGRAYGTPYYISPEQIRGEVDITPAADLYSLGATIYHLVTGRVPFPGKNPSDVMRRHLKQDLIPPDHINESLSAGFSQIIEMMMAKEVSQRYQNARDLLSDIDAVMAGDQPKYAQPTLDFAMLSKVAKETSSGAPVAPQTIHPSTGNPLTTTYLALLIISAIVNVILLAVLVAS
ncbi:MAG: serine/threonine-protein kinase [Phycisphaerales bacterium]|jgi:serine/threonine-protein kinase|nr:serine/threonine-protein kinase [Phycisphaerales bacterium]